MRHLYCLLLTASVGTLTACSGGDNPSVPPVDNPPTLSDIADSSIEANSAELRIEFTVSDDQTTPSALTTVVESSNSGLFADPGPVIEGNAGDRELVITPAAGTVGSATLTLSVTDASGQVASRDFVVTVTPQQVAFDTALRSTFAANENDEPQTINDKEFQNDASSFDDLLSP